MRNFLDQRRRCKFFLTAFLLLMLFAVLMFFFYSPLVLKDIGGYTWVNLDSTVFGKEMPSGSLVILQPSAKDKLEKDDIFIYQLSENGKKYVYAAILVEDMGGGEYVTKVPGNDTLATLKLESAAVLGKKVISVPYVGSALLFMNSIFGYIISGATAIFILIGTAVYLVIKRKHNPHPRVLGVNVKKLNREDAYIYAELIEFFKKAHFVIEPGEGVDYVIAKYYNSKFQKTSSNLFAEITYQNESMYVKINRDFERGDNVVTREGYIKIEKSIFLPDALKKIKLIYKQYFSTPNKR